MEIISGILKWRGIAIKYKYTPRYCAAACPTLSHLEVTSVEPPRARLPITETGYKSMFFYSELIYTEEQIVSMLADKLDITASKTGWQQKTHEQMSLF